MKPADVSSSLPEKYLQLAAEAMPEAASFHETCKVARAIQAATAAAYEDAARVADARTVGGYYHGSPEWADGPEIAAAIRALKHSTDR